MLGHILYKATDITSRKIKYQHKKMVSGELSRGKCSTQTIRPAIKKMDFKIMNTSRPKGPDEGKGSQASRSVCEKSYKKGSL